MERSVTNADEPGHDAGARDETGEGDGEGAHAPLPDRAREWAFRVLYAKTFTGKTAMQAVSDVDRCFRMSDEAWEEAGNLSRYLPDPRAALVPESVWERNRDVVFETLRGLDHNRGAIDAAIKKASPRWRIDRMPVVDRSLLALGAYELLIAGARPTRRVINRTVELAKRYGEADSRRFVNGILDQIRKDARLPG
jgi:transcription antitermination factor NusB